MAAYNDGEGMKMKAATVAGEGDDGGRGHGGGREECPPLMGDGSSDGPSGTFRSRRDLVFLELPIVIRHFIDS